MTRKVAEHRVKARFFCEACGAEVKGGALSCPSCGRMFAAVRCPECGFAGKAVDFKAGCPVCGKGAPTLSGTSPVPSVKRRRGASLPPWFYPVIMAALAALAVALLAVLLLS